MITSEYFCLIFFSICILNSATDENLSLRYLPMGTDDQVLSSNKRFHQIMQGSPTDVSWPQPPKMKKDTVDVKAEINKLNISYVWESNWPSDEIKLGAVTAVSFDGDGNVVIFHRVNRVWDQNTFNLGNVFQQRKLGPILENTILAYNRENGNLVYSWGSNLFYMPHGLTIDHEDNVWVTDVALHQVFKFGPKGGVDKKPLLTLGTAFTPGAGDKRFCKPTSVAVLENGDFFVADGYCNARILKYSKNGDKILSWGQNSFSGVSYDIAPKNFFAIPHALTLVPEKELICTADRENGRIQCFFWKNGTFHSQYHNSIVGDRLFSMDYTPAEGGLFVIVNGPTAELGIKPEHYNEVRGYVMNMTTKRVLSKFGPNNMEFKNPHDIAITKDGKEIYVAELNPMRIYKFVKGSASAATSSLNHIKVDSSISSAIPISESEINSNNTNTLTDMHTSHMPGVTAIVVSTLMILFALMTFGLAYFVARRKKRGCFSLGTKSRRHAWDYPIKSDGFNLSGLLMDRRKKRNGFEQLDQNDSDEENEMTNLNANAENNNVHNTNFPFV